MKVYELLLLILLAWYGGSWWRSRGATDSDIPTAAGDFQSAEGDLGIEIIVRLDCHTLWSVPSLIPGCCREFADCWKSTTALVQTRGMLSSLRQGRHHSRALRCVKLSEGLLISTFVRLVHLEGRHARNRLRTRRQNFGRHGMSAVQLGTYACPACV